MIVFILILLVILSFLMGYGLAVFLLARDPDVIRLGADEAIIKKPKEGLIMIACPPEVARRIITHPEGYESSEARAMYQNKQ
jgi:hypothetical protein